MHALARLVVAAATVFSLGTQAIHAQPVRMSMEMAGEMVEIEVRDLNRDTARAEIQAALSEMHRIRTLLDGEGEAPDGVAALNAHAGEDARPVDRHVGAALIRAQSFCLWSNGAFGPMGGNLAALARQTGGPEGADASVFGRAVSSAGCANLRVVPGGEDAPSTAMTAAATRIDLAGWARGYAMDVAVDRLVGAGASNLWIESGPVRRGLGDGPSGQGWLAVLSFPGHNAPIDELWLRGQALAVSLPLATDRAGAPILRNHRNGRAVEGVVAVVAVSELAVDAEALANSSAILGPREGRMRVASLEPPPSILWLLGEGRGRPLRTEYRWAELRRIRKR